MELFIDLDVPRSPSIVAPFVNDLTAYPQWMGLVHSAVVEQDSTERAWSVELRAKVGPFARSKRLRMVRTIDESPTHFRFERRERGTGSHGTWMLDVHLDGESTTRLTVTLRYVGRLWSSVVERVLRDEIERSKRRLATLVSES